MIKRVRLAQREAETVLAMRPCVDRNELDWLLMQGVSGVITDDVPMLRDVAQFRGLPS